MAGAALLARAECAVEARVALVARAPLGSAQALAVARAASGAARHAAVRPAPPGRAEAARQRVARRGAVTRAAVVALVRAGGYSTLRAAPARCAVAGASLADAPTAAAPWALRLGTQRPPPPVVTGAPGAGDASSMTRARARPLAHTRPQQPRHRAAAKAATTAATAAIAAIAIAAIATEGGEGITPICLGLGLGLG